LPRTLPRIIVVVVYVNTIKSTAESYMQAWASKQWIADNALMPPAPPTVAEMYLVHRAMQDHALAQSAFGGLAGYKLGAVGVIEGEAAISAPLFTRFVVDASTEASLCGGVVSAAEINMHNLEAEVGVIMAADLEKKTDGRPYSADEVCVVTLS